MLYILHGFHAMQNIGPSTLNIFRYTDCHLREIIHRATQRKFRIKIDLYQFHKKHLFSSRYILNILLAIKPIGRAKPQAKNPVLYLVP